MLPIIERPFCLDDYRPFLKSLVDSEDASRLLLKIEACEVGWALGSGENWCIHFTFRPLMLSEVIRQS
jgi:hypothetical protein